MAKDQDEVISAFKNLPSDSAFKAGFSNASISKQKIARFYLRALEEEFSGGSCEQVPSMDTYRVNLEHVLPSTPTQEWDATFKSDEFRAYHNRLGNLAIMSSKLNSIVGNGSFASKCEIYKKSSFHFTKSIADEAVWNKQAIESRQLKMAELAVKVWAL